MRGYLPVITQLRCMYPEESWSYNRSRKSWDTKTGWHVYLAAPPQDGAPDWESQPGHYRRSDTGAIVFNAGGGLVLEKEKSRFDLIRDFD